MREYIDIVKSSFKQELKESSSKSILKEFLNTSVLNVNTVVAHLEHLLGQKLYRVGGPTRVYDIDGGGHGAVFVIGTTSMMAVGIAWPNRSAGVRSIYVWHDFSINKAPPYCIDLPNVDFELIAPTVVSLIHHPQYGKIPVTESRKKNGNTLTEGARVSVGEFIAMANKWAAEKGKDASRLTLSDLQQIAQDNDTFIPGEVRNRKDLKNPNSPRGLPWYNLSGASSFGGGEIDTAAAYKALGDVLGGEMLPSMPQDGEADDDWDTALSLGKIKQAQKMAAQDKIWLAGRKNGKFFTPPREIFGQLLAQLERLYAREMAEKDPENEGKSSMEIQYEDLEDKVRLVAGGKSNFVKSLLITGMPSSGKSWRVMNIIRNELGLKDGEDYIVKKGFITVNAMFRVLIEQCNNGLAIFDDCDSVVGDKRGINMLKGALDTDPVREISNDKTRGIVNTAVMKAEVRDEYVSRLSELLRGKRPTAEDAKFFAAYVPARALKQSKAEREEDEAKLGGDEDDENDIEGIEFDDDLSNKENRIIEYVMTNLPNKIDFKGRIIFISNMNEDEWDSAILSRAFTVNLSFESGEMLEFIDKIKDKIKTPGVSEEMKQEVIDYIRELYSIGKIKSQINFRLIMSAFDYALLPNWQRLVKQL